MTVSRRTSRSRVASLAVAASALALTLVPISPARAGGGCHDAAGASEGAGQTVELSSSCMRPTVLRVEAGAAVTFVNRDPIEHNVFGLGWADDSVEPGGSAVRRFDAAGTYPYACIIHPGMVGAVVVGDGRGSGAVVEVAAPDTGLGPATPAAASAPAPDRNGGIGWWPAVAAAIAVAAIVLAFRLGRYRSGITKQRSSSAPSA